MGLQQLAWETSEHGLGHRAERKSLEPERCLMVAEAEEADPEAIVASTPQGSGPKEQHTAPAAPRSGLGSVQGSGQALASGKQPAANQAAPKHSPVSAAELQSCLRLGRHHIYMDESYHCSCHCMCDAP